MARSDSTPGGRRCVPAGEFVSALLAREGAEYEWGGTARRTGFDCSGIIYRILANKGFSIPRTSTTQIAHAHKISVADGARTVGALMWFPGHIATSMGDGRTIEARGEDYGVMVVSAADNAGRFKSAGLLPEVCYSGDAEIVEAGGSRGSRATPADSTLTKLATSFTDPAFWQRVVLTLVGTGAVSLGAASMFANSRVGRRARAVVTRRAAA